MNQKQVAESLNISSATVGRYTKALSKHHVNFTHYVGGKRIYDVKAFRAIKYMNLLVNKGMLIEESVIPVLRDIYELDVKELGVTQCHCNEKLQKQLDSYAGLVEQQQATIAFLVEKLAER